MKKILFSAYSLDVGGIETALITLLKALESKYDITLVLEKKQGIFLPEVPKSVKIITYMPSNKKNVLLRKIDNFFKQLSFKMKYKNKFDFSGCYATYSFPASFVARTASRNSALWVHNNYMNFYDNDILQYRKFFKDLKVYDYKKIVFVSNLDKRVFMAQFPECSKKTTVCNNLIDYKTILKKAEEDDDEKNKLKQDELIINKRKEKSKAENKKGEENNSKEELTTFINIGRHDEKQKRLSRIIRATKRLNKEGYKFKVIFIGKGTDTNEYKEIAKNIKNIEFLGAKKNPYPYLKNSSAMIMSSEFEGYPVVFVEAQILGKPIITTDVSDAKSEIEGKYGIVVERSDRGVYNGMKEFMDKGCKIEKFDPEKYNQKIIEKLEEIMQDKR